MKFMGEKVKDIGKLTIKGANFDIELNEPIDSVSGGTIHIQNNDFRMDMPQIDFYEMAATVILAKAQLLHIKNTAYQKEGADA
jgi:hypothetical protein